MSYMNDDCDPFGVPYTKTSNRCCEKVEKVYSFNDLKEIAEEEWELFQKMNKVKENKKDAIEHLKNKIKGYVGSFAEIECDKFGDWKIITDSFELSQLEKLKEDFDLKDIKVISSNIEKNFIIKLVIE